MFITKPGLINWHFLLYSRSSIYHSVEGPLTYVLNGELITEPRPLPPPPILPPLPPQPLPTHTSQASFVSALAMDEESSMEAEKTAEPGPVTRQPHVMVCYQNYLAHYQVQSLIICPVSCFAKFTWDCSYPILAFVRHLQLEEARCKRLKWCISRKSWARLFLSQLCSDI